MMKLAETILEEITGVCDQVKEEQVNDCLDQLNKEHAIFVDGEGRSGLVIRCFAMRLVHLGYRAYVISESTTPAMKKGDVFIGVSGSGSTSTITMHMEKAKAKGCNIIGISAKTDSVLAGMSDHMLLIPGAVKGDQGEQRASIQLLSSLFDQSLHVIMDMMALMLSQRDHISNKEATGHHF